MSAYFVWMSTTVVQTEITTLGWIAMKFCTDVHGFQWMRPNDFGDPYFSSSSTPRLNFVICSETPQQLLDGLP